MVVAGHGQQRAGVSIGVATPHVAAGLSQSFVRRAVPYRIVGGVGLRLDEYLPRAGGPHAAVIFVHGGGFRSGERGAFAPGEAAYAATGLALALENFAAFAIDYRLAPRFPFPAAESDVLAAVRWVRRHALALRVDPIRLALFGASSGGNLAVLAATDPRGPLDQGERVRAVVSWSGPMDLARFYPDHPFVGEYVGCAPFACPGRYRAASPVNHVDGADPPIFLATGTAESVPLTQAREMISRLSAARVAHQLITIPGGQHAGEYAPKAWPSTLRFLRRYLTP